LAFVVNDPVTADIIPNEKYIFTVHVDPVSPPADTDSSQALGKQPEFVRMSFCLYVVEAPGTAPGSATPIPYTVYRHSRLPDAFYIGIFAAEGKVLCRAGEFRD
jgi:hypothetical protein